MTLRLLPSAAAALMVLGTPFCAGCSSADAPAVAALPSTAGQLEELLLDRVPSGLPLVPDGELVPPAGPKTIDDVSRYGEDADTQRQVLQDYGYRRGWERFWRSGDALTSVFLDQFGAAAGAGSYAADLARNDADYYGGQLDGAPGDLPAGCVLLTRDGATSQHGLTGPAAFAWCASGVFTVSVAAVAATPAAARAELTAVTVEQLDRLPIG